MISCIDPVSNLHLCRMNSGSIQSIGKNINGYENFLPDPVLSIESTNGFYEDTITFDLKIITNTSIFYYYSI